MCRNIPKREWASVGVGIQLDWDCVGLALVIVQVGLSLVACCAGAHRILDRTVACAGLTCVRACVRACAGAGAAKAHPGQPVQALGRSGRLLPVPVRPALYPFRAVPLARRGPVHVCIDLPPAAAGGRSLLPSPSGTASGGSAGSRVVCCLFEAVNTTRAAGKSSSRRTAGTLSISQRMTGAGVPLVRRAPCMLRAVFLSRLLTGCKMQMERRMNM